jgi:hypothetical protein
MSCSSNLDEPRKVDQSERVENEVGDEQQTGWASRLALVPALPQNDCVNLPSVASQAEVPRLNLKLLEILRAELAWVPNVAGGHSEFLGGEPMQIVEEEPRVAPPPPRKHERGTPLALRQI